MSELDVADPDGTGRVDTILVSVAPPDGAAIAAALRDRGFAVMEAPLAMATGGALGEPPQVMIVDVDLPGVVDAIERAREAAPRAELLGVGDPTRAADLGLSRADGRAFERPVDVEALLLAVVALAEPAIDLQKLDSAPSPIRRLDSEAPPASEYPSTSDPLEVAAILPAFDDPEAFGAIAPLEVSAELAQLLEAADQRVNAVGVLSPSSGPGPEEELDLILPADMLASLDEPLAPDDDSSAPYGSGAQTGGGTGFPRPRTSGEPSATASPATAAGTLHERGTAADTAAGRSSAGRASEAGPPPLRAEPAVDRDDLGRGEVPDRAAPTPREIADEPPPARRAPATGPITPAPSAPPVVLPALAPPLSGSMPEPSSAVPRVASSHHDAGGREPALPAVLGPGDAVRALAAAIAARASGSLALGPEAALRRIVLHDGDVVTAASAAPDESLVAFLAARGDLERDVAMRLSGRLPAFGRHAGAALIAHGHLGQDDLWPVLRAHAEWIIARALTSDEGTSEIEGEPPGRLKAEPNVFGGATGAEVMLEAMRRALPPAEAQRRLGGLAARIAPGPRQQLLIECALAPHEEAAVRGAAGRTVGEVLSGAAPELADVLYGLVALGVLSALPPSRRAEPAPDELDPLDEEAVRQRVRARVALVEDGDYFALLGVPRAATAYEIRRAYLDLRRAFDPARVLTAATADLAPEVRLVIEVLDEAYEILREPHRRDRYRRAIEAGPPG